MTEYTFFSQGVDRWRKEMALMWGISTFAPCCDSFIFPSLPQWTILPEQPQGLGGEAEGLPQHHLPAGTSWEEATADRKYGLLTIWINPCQARVHSMEEAVGKVTVWVSSGPDWPYMLVHLHEGTCHVPLPKEGHLGILPQWGAEMTACRRISQLEVCQLLISGLQVAYPIGFNGCEEPIITSLPESLANGISLTGGKSIYLEIDIPQSLAEELDWKALPIAELSTIVIASPHKTTPQKLEEEVSMTMEVRNLLSQVMLDTSGHGSEKTKDSGHHYTPTSQAKGAPSAGGYLVPGKYPKRMPRGWGISRGGPYHHLSHSHNY